MQKIRESNFDLLRIISAFSVVMLHVSGVFLQYDDMNVPTNCNLVVIIFNHIVRFAVPCFFMLSGSFILADERNADYKYFYKKSVKNIGITAVVFCLLYLIYSIVKLTAKSFVGNRLGIDIYVSGLFGIFKVALAGLPFGHLWYLFTLFGLYLAAPFVIRIAADLRGGGVNLYGGITSIFLALSSVSYITSEHELMWDVGWQFCFLSYFLMGYKLRQWGRTRRNNWIALILISAGTALNVTLAYINYLRGLRGLPVDVIQYYKNPFSYAPLAPIEVLASCLIFAGFSVMDIKKDFSKLARHTFLIYLLHLGVWDVISTILGDRLLGNYLMETLSVFLISIIVFLLALLGAKLYKVNAK